MGGPLTPRELLSARQAGQVGHTRAGQSLEPHKLEEQQRWAWQNPHEAFQKQSGTATVQEASEGEGGEEGADTGCWGPCGTQGKVVLPVACKERFGGLRT